MLNCIMATILPKAAGYEAFERTPASFMRRSTVSGSFFEGRNVAVQAVGFVVVAQR